MGKKIGILTFHRSINNGAFMQAYSLSKKLSEKLGCKVEIINYNNRDIEKKYIVEIVKSRPLSIKAVWQRFSMYRSFRRVLKTLPLSEFKIIDNKFDVLFEKLKKEYDFLVVGSDAVWNWTLRGFPNPYLLNIDYEGKLYSYAASAHGMKLAKVTEEQLSYCKEALSKYSFIGVRDGNTERFVRNVSGDLNPIHTCDPTVFLDMDKVPCDIEKLKERIKKKYGISFKKPIIGIMSENEQIGKLVREKYGEKYDIVAVFKANKYADYFLYDLTPYEWSRVFSFFELTFSQYFHGTLLSLKNLTPVIAIDVWKLEKDTVAKLQDVLERLDLSYSYFKIGALTDDVMKDIYNLADEFLKNPPKEAIYNALCKESQSADAFFEKIKEDFENV